MNLRDATDDELLAELADRLEDGETLYSQCGYTTIRVQRWREPHVFFGGRMTERSPRPTHPKEKP